ncbi:hypothetical protein HX845_34560, partial [Pseudomonas gingeri]|nr:hypothetical protein [Pseudomonas gingeri]
LADAASTTVIGLDDELHGKPKGTEHMVFGLFNAATVVVPRLVNAFRTAEGTAGNVEPNTVYAVENPAPNSLMGVEPHVPRVDAPLPDFSLHALPDHFLEGRALR